jgi:HSP20 family protein
MFREMEELMAKDFRELSKKAPKNTVREKTLPSGAKLKHWDPFVYGYNRTLGPDGKVQIHEFGNLKLGTLLGRPRLNIKERRIPLADVITTDSLVRIVVELPGVFKEDINLSGTEESMTVSVDTGTRQYYKKLDLPVRANPKTTKSKYINGVLEITMKKLENEESGGDQIRID